MRKFRAMISFSSKAPIRLAYKPYWKNSRKRESMKQQKLRVGVIFGGRSCEHDVSLHSAAYILANLDTKKYEVIPRGITREGTWLLDVTPDEMRALEERTDEQAKRLAGDTTVPDFLTLESGKPAGIGPLDVIFPVLH